MHFVLMAPAIWLQLKPGSQHGRVMRPGAPHSAYEAVHIAASLVLRLLYGLPSVITMTTEF